jgi:hypothetical protein
MQKSEMHVENLAELVTRQLSLLILKADALIIRDSFTSHSFLEINNVITPVGRILWQGAQIMRRLRLTALKHVDCVRAKIEKTDFQ